MSASGLQRKVHRQSEEVQRSEVHRQAVSLLLPRQRGAGQVIPPRDAIGCLVDGITAPEPVSDEPVPGFKIHYTQRSYYDEQASQG